MECSEARTALSARLDGEDSALPSDAVDAHVAGCPECRAWFSTASALGRHLRLTTVPSEPAHPSSDEVTARVLSAADDFPAVTSGLRRRELPLMLARVVLGVVALIYVAWAVVLLVGATADPVSPADPNAMPGGPFGAARDPHMARFIIDAATSRFALAAGLAWAAFSPKTAGPLLPVYVGMFAFGAGFATRDVVLGLLGEGYGLAGTLVPLVLQGFAVAALVTCWLARHHAVTPLSQSWRALTARPMNFSASDVKENSSFRPGGL